MTMSFYYVATHKFSMFLALGTDESDDLDTRYKQTA